MGPQAHILRTDTQLNTLYQVKKSTIYLLGVLSSSEIPAEALELQSPPQPWTPS